MYYFKLGQSSVHSMEYASQMFLVDCVMSIMLGIMLFVLFLMLFLLLMAGVCKKLYVNFGSLELLCGVVPIFLLLLQVYYSYSNISWDSEVYLDWGDSKKWVQIKVGGHQWFWSYEFLGLGSWMNFESYMLANRELDVGGLRLLEVNNRLYLPVDRPILVGVTSADVIHSWSLPDYSIKLDAIPGMTNYHILYFPMLGIYYGMCSEICGAGHTYMPIVVEVSPSGEWDMWVEDLKHKFDIITRLGDWYHLYGVSSFPA